jgi:four helix bundle protein
VPANLAEGHGRSGRDRLHFWRIAYASAKEFDSHLQLLAGAGVIDQSKANTTLKLFDQVRAMTWRLLNPKSEIRNARVGGIPNPSFLISVPLLPCLVPA